MPQINKTEQIIKDLKVSPMFNLSLASKELFHSNFLAWIGASYPEQFKQICAKLLEVEELQWKEGWEVRREYKNWDLCVVGPEYNEGEAEEKKGEILRQVYLIIENKVKSVPYKSQLDRYYLEAIANNIKYYKKHKGKLPKDQTIKEIESLIDNTLKANNGRKKKEENKTTYSDAVARISQEKNKKNLSKIGIPQFILLSLQTEFPSRNQIKEGSIWTIKSYDGYHKAIKDTFDSSSKIQLNEVSKSIIKDYWQFISNLHQLATNWSFSQKNWKGEPFLYYEIDNEKKKRKINDELEALIPLRIKDIYQKLKFSRICNLLEKEIENAFKNNPRLERNIHIGDIKLNRFRPNSITLNTGYLHDEPLIEIYIPFEKDAAYIIQIQGDAYEHGVLKDNIIEAKLWNDIKHQGWLVDNWIYTGQGQKEVDVISGGEIFVGPLRPNNNKVNGNNKKKKEPKEPKEYYKYQMTKECYIYQSRQLSTAATIQNVVGYMVNDLTALLKNRSK